jgi:ribosome-associated protein
MISLEDIKKSTEKSFAHSSGAGGQNVNKRSTKVFLVFDIQKSTLNKDEKQKLTRKFPSEFIQVWNQETRSQFRNTALAFQHLQKLIEESLKIEKLRKRVVPRYRTASGKLQKTKKAHLQKYKNRYLEY